MGVGMVVEDMAVEVEVVEEGVVSVAVEEVMVVEIWSRSRAIIMVMVDQQKRLLKPVVSSFQFFILCSSSFMLLLGLQLPYTC